MFVDYADTVFRPKLGHTPPVRGLFGEATIEIKPGWSPVKQKPFALAGERRTAMEGLVKNLIEEGKIEAGYGPWCSPAFPVAKKAPGQYRIVIDYRRVNDATVEDAQPLPRIQEILVNQGKYKIWTVLDLKDGFHQVPIREDCRYITCMSTPLGLYQWKVLAIGLKNAPAIFQRTMEGVLWDLEL